MSVKIKYKSLMLYNNTTSLFKYQITKTTVKDMLLKNVASVTLVQKNGLLL